MSTSANRREQVRRQQEAVARAQRTRRMIGLIGGAIALLLIGVLAYVMITSTAERTAAPVSTAGPTSVGPLAPQVIPRAANETSNALVVAKGRPGTPVLTLYLDYQCPNCRSFEEGFSGMLTQTARAGDWTLQYKTMTFMDAKLTNTASTRAAMAAACAAETDRFEAFSNLVYAHQATREVRGSEGYSDQTLRDAIPPAAGITGDALTTFRACYDGRATHDFVAAVNESARADGVTGTPTLTINGRAVDFNQVAPFTPDGLKEYVLANA